jgi:predicted metal-dependent phosphoesterase TrpH
MQQLTYSQGSSLRNRLTEIRPAVLQLSISHTNLEIRAGAPQAREKVADFALKSKKFRSLAGHRGSISPSKSDFYRSIPDCTR